MDVPSSAKSPMQMFATVENPAVTAMYGKYLDKPMSHKAHELLHTRYFVKVKK